MSGGRMEYQQIRVATSKATSDTDFALVFNKTLLVVWQVLGRCCLPKNFWWSWWGFSRRKVTFGNYESSYSKWPNWCDTEKTDPFGCPLNYIFKYSIHLFRHRGFAFIIIGLHRSAIFTYPVHIYHKTFGQHPLLCSLILGVFNSRLRSSTAKVFLFCECQICIRSY